MTTAVRLSLLEAVVKAARKVVRCHTDDSLPLAGPRCGSWMPRGCPCDDYYQTTPDPEDVHAS